MSHLERSGRDFVEATRALDEPTEADRRRIHAATLARIAAGAAGAAAATKAATALAATPAAAGGGWLSGAVVGALLGLAVVGVEAAVEVATGRSPLERPSASVAPPSPPPPPPPGRAISSASAPPPASIPPGERAAPTPSPTSVIAAPGAASVEPRGGEAPSAPSRSSLDEELAVLRQAQEALRDGKPDEAAALLDRFGAARPGGALVEERRAARLVAACKAGRGHELRGDVEAFLHDHPESPLAVSVGRACAEK